MTVQTVYDVVVVGAGIAGALVAKQAGLAGLKVLILEAGEGLPPNINGFMERFYTATAKVPEIPYTPALFDDQGLVDPTTMNAPRPTVLTLGPGNWQDPKQSYLDQQGPLAFASTYERLAGGTMRHWLGTSLRFVPNDFRMFTAYGVMTDWPLGYDDLEPWYGRAEAEIGVSANVADQAYLGITFGPDYQYPMPSIPASLVDDAVTAAVTGQDFQGLPLVVSPTPAGRNSVPYQNRRQCAGNTNCIPICPIQAKYDPSVTLNAALDTGNVTFWTKTVACEVLLDDALREVTGIGYKQYDTPGGGETGSGVVQGRRYVLAAHAIETPRLLLMSTQGGRLPAGVANTSGQVGKHLMDHPLYLAWALTKPGQPVFGFRGPLATSGSRPRTTAPSRSPSNSITSACLDRRSTTTCRTTPRPGSRPPSRPPIRSST
jgi:choline dehydrogenase-like flavoprotein